MITDAADRTRFVEEPRFGARITWALQELAHHNKPCVLASAVLGPSGLQRVVLAGVSRVTGRKSATFDAVAAAGALAGGAGIRTSGPGAGVR